MAYELYQPVLSREVLQRFGLSLVTSKPSPQLSTLVHRFLQVSASSPSPYPVVPSGLSAMFCGPSGILLTTSTSRPMALQLPKAGDYFGILFCPGSLRQFINVPMADLHNRLVNIKDLSIPLFDRLAECLYSVTTFQQRVSLCEGVFGAGRTEVPVPLLRAIEIITRNKGSVSLGQDLAKSVGVSIRQINRLFSDYLGMSTKKFAQVVRLQNVCEYLHKDPSSSLLTANALGYADQSHLLKDFRNHLSESPTLFFKRFTSDFYNTGA